MVKVSPTALGAVLDMMASVTDEVTFSESPEGGWECMATDRAHVAMCRCTLDAESLGADGWAVEISRLRRALKGDEADISVEGGRLTVVAGRVRTVLPLVEPADRVRFPTLDLPAEVAILSSDLSEAVMVDDPRKVSCMRFVLDDGGLTMAAEEDGGTGYDRSVTVPPEECIDMLGSAATAMPLDYVARLAKAVPKGSDIRLGMADAYPLSVSVSGEGWTAVWMCAPRISDE